MYKTSRSQREFWGSKRRQIQKKNRSKNIEPVVKWAGSTEGYFKIKALNNRFLKRVGLL